MGFFPCVCAASGLKLNEIINIISIPKELIIQRNKSKIYLLVGIRNEQKRYKEWGMTP
jgi:hypothetical protein